MKIVQIIDSLAVGGAEKLVRETVPLLVEKGYEVDVVLLNGLHTHLYRELEALNCCKIYSLGNSIYSPLNIIKLIPFLYRYDIAHVHLFPAQYFAVIARIFCLKKIKLIFTEHNTSNRRLESGKYKHIEKFIYAFYNKIICITEEVKKVLIEKTSLTEKKLKVVKNGVNLSNVVKSTAKNRKDFNYSETDKLLIMVAGFREQKDQDTVIRSLKLLPPQYKLLLVGDGERKKILKNLVNSLELNNRVSFLGVRDDVYSLIKMCDISILSSHWEGFGLVAVEAMASKVPLIASNVDGLAQVVEGGGILFEPKNEQDLVQKILDLSKDEYYNEVAYRCFCKAAQFDITFMVDRLIEIYNEN
ncbi:hypothetical protein BA768_11150 [Chryseobacterium sp. CBo1]|uniref:glycosyltransferase n=1 Tax=Chryseobacterium sp. CBo1 TaxID=1869230 RepID=UPI000810D554|nr:glycosyltransferase [Chryseobacterium sp. CBo1]OCK52666.1 hypothetical protein BA768_11150 [Chryseobacterium sp. CBo1]